VAIAVLSFLSSDRIGNSGRPYIPRASKSHADIYLRLWDSTEQVALECTPILVLDGITTCTSTLKNLVLPGIRHFTILDPHKVTPADAGNDFFMEGPSSIGKYRAEEAVRLLLELNDGVDGKADTRSLGSVINTEEGRTWIKTF
jgi:amyloid beta precursor protein binding protein 1